MICNKLNHISDRRSRPGPKIAFVSTTIILLLLLNNANYFNSAALAQRTTPRSNETQNLEQEPSSPSTTTEGQNQNQDQNIKGQATSANTPTATSQITSKLGSSGEDLMSGTPGNDLILGL